VAVLIRPEFISVPADLGTSRNNIFHGRLISLVFVGDAYEGEIRVGDTDLITRIEPTAEVREGDEIAFSFKPEQCSLLSR
jgi:iron(III) transport system ATP-binding protein